MGVKVKVGDTEEEVHVDPEKGPYCLTMTGGVTNMTWHDTGRVTAEYARFQWPFKKPWPEMSETEKEVHLNITAKKNKLMRQRQEDIAEKGIDTRPAGWYF